MKNRLSPRFLVSPHARKSQFFTSQNQFHSPSPSPQHAFSQQPDSIPETSCSQPDALDLPFSAKAHDGIARRGGRSPSAARKLPEQKPRSPRGMVEYGKPSGANPWERRGTTSPAGSSGGSAEGASPKGLCLAAPNRPPSAPAGGGPNNIKRKALVPEGHKSRPSKDKPCNESFASPPEAAQIT